LLIFAIVGDKVAATFHFSSNLFFDFFLPLIIFNSGFTMRKKKFFNNLGNVAVFGLCVTIVCFVLYSAEGVVLLIMAPRMSNYYAINNDIDIVGEENP